MKLHELVKLRNELEQVLDLSVIHEELEKNSKRLRDLVSICDPEYGETLTAIADQHSSIIERAKLDKRQIQHTINNINLDINTLSEKFLSKNYQLELAVNDIESVRNVRHLQISSTVSSLLLNRIQFYSKWQYPALELGCRDGEWTRHLVASDPLYIADIFNEFLTSAVEQFEPVYRGRVRKYLIDDFQIKGLPANQFGFIFSYNFFNYLSLDSIKQFLIQAMDWLRPGGTMLFTYNNADLCIPAGYAENYYMSYVPKSILVPLCESIGFQVIHTHDFETAVSWVEIQKGGKLDTIKAGQALGEIKTIRH